MYFCCKLDIIKFCLNSIKKLIFSLEFIWIIVDDYVSFSPEQLMVYRYSGIELFLCFSKMKHIIMLVDLSKKTELRANNW